MLRRFFASLLAGAAAYVTTVLLGLMAFHPLAIVFWRSLWVLMGVTAAAFILLNFIAIISGEEEKRPGGKSLQHSPEKAGRKYSERQNNEKESENESGEESENPEQDGRREAEQEEEASQEDFSPLDPPVLETEEE